jgi:hypothetical protein
MFRAMVRQHPHPANARAATGIHRAGTGTALPRCAGMTQTDARLPGHDNGTFMKIATPARLAVFCLCALALHAVVAGEAAPQGAAATSTVELRDLRKSMSKAEERFLALYNKFNRDADQQMSCNDSAPTGSRLSKRSCSTRAQTRANEELARNYVAAAAGSSTDEAQASIAGKVAQEKLEFQKNLQKLLDANPELRRSFEEYLAARQQYQQAGGRL